MKRLLTTLSLVAAGATALAQNGYISINNTPSTLFHTNSVSVGGASGNVPNRNGGSFYYEVLTAPSTVTAVDASLQDLLTSTWSDTGVSGTNISIFSGRVAGLGPTVANNWPLFDQPPFVPQSFIVVGWSATLGSDWAQVKPELAGAALVPLNGSYAWLMPNFYNPFEGGFLGATTVGSAIPGESPGTFAALFSSMSSAQVPVPVTTSTELYITIIPEPGSLAVAGLGVASLLFFRRRE